MEKHNRAQRRHDNKRLKKNRELFWYREKKYMTPKRLGQALHTPCNCSCTMCGNPRKHFHRQSLDEVSFYQAKLHKE